MVTGIRPSRARRIRIQLLLLRRLHWLADATIKYRNRRSNHGAHICIRIAHDRDDLVDGLGRELTGVLGASNERDFDRVFAALIQLRAGALVIGTDAFLTSHSEQLAALALRHALPAIFQYPEFTAAGGLMSYGNSLMESFRTVGIYTGRILKGEKPADLPVQQITKVELIINLKTAKALGLTVPLPLSGRADELIE